MSEPDIPEEPQPAGLTNGARLGLILGLVLGPPLVNALGAAVRSGEISVATVVLLPITSIAAGVLTAPLLAKTTGAVKPGWGWMKFPSSAAETKRLSGLFCVLYASRLLRACLKKGTTHLWAGRHCFRHCSSVTYRDV